MRRGWFSDRQALDTLNEIVFFHVGAAVEKLRAQAKKDGKPLFAIDAINLLESGMGNGCDVTVGILAPKPVRLARIMARDHLSEQAARARIDAQKPDEFYRTGCQVLLTNDTSLRGVPGRIPPPPERHHKGGNPMTKEQRDALLYQPKNGYDRLTQAEESGTECLLRGIQILPRPLQN